MGVQSVVLTLVVLACYASQCDSLLIVDGSAYVFDEPELVEAVLDPSVSKILVAADIQLTPGAWPSPEPVQVERTITVSPHNYGVQNFTVDASNLTSAVISCTHPSCWFVIEGQHSLTFINIPGASTASFDALFPNFLKVNVNGSLTVADVDVISLQPTALWSASNALYSTNATWANSLLISCDSPASLLVDGLSVSSAIGLDPSLPLDNAKGVGRMQLSDVRMQLARSFVCSRNYTSSLCEDVQEICNSGASTQPLPADSCKSSSLAAMCTASVTPSTNISPGHIDDLNNARDSPTEKDSTPRWWIGLVAGAVSGLCCLILVCYLVHMLRARRRARQGAGLEEVKPGPHAAKGFGSTTPCAQDEHERIESGGSTPPGQRTTAPSSTTTSAVTPVANGQPLPDASLRPNTGMVLPWGAWAQHLPVSPEELTGFSYHSSVQDDFTMLSNGSLPAAMKLAKSQERVPSGVTSQGNGHCAVVIDLAPAQPAEPYQAQLSRNPLGVTLQTLLGTGAYGTVYAGLWQGQPAAIKVIKQQVHTGEDLEAILQFREATLGAELQHPRIVRTLAHALVIPEGMVDESGRLARPGPVEAHIVSSLCDCGTLKGWLQLIWRAQTASNPPMPSTAQQTRLGAFVGDAQAQHNAAVASAAAPHQQLSGRLTSSFTVGSFAAVKGHSPQASPAHDQGTSQSAGSISLVVMDRHQGGSSSWDSLEGVSTVPMQGTDSLETSLQPVGRIQDKAGLAPQHLTRMDADVMVLSREGTTIGSAKVQADNMSSGTKAAVTVYPPLACMPVWGTTGLQLHSQSHFHLLAVLDCLLEVADGLRYLLSRGVVHGDLKPQNCLLCSEPADKIRGFTVKIGDFGISRVLHDTKSHTTVTQPPGTLAYFAPELLSTCRLSPACDLYSFGIIMYELLTCKQPLGSLTMAQVLYKKATGKVDEFLLYPVEAPQEYVKLARACYSLEASSRPSLHEVLGRLAALREHLVLDWDAAAAPGPGPTLSPPGSTYSLRSHDSSSQEHASSKQDSGRHGAAGGLA